MPGARRERYRAGRIRSVLRRPLSCSRVAVVTAYTLALRGAVVRLELSIAALPEAGLWPAMSGPGGSEAAGEAGGVDGEVAPAVGAVGVAEQERGAAGWDRVGDGSGFRLPYGPPASQGDGRAREGGGCGVVPAGGGDDAVEGAEVFLVAALDDREEAGRATEAHRSGVGLPDDRLGLRSRRRCGSPQGAGGRGRRGSGVGPRAGRYWG